jgi:hypothetical protein
LKIEDYLKLSSSAGFPELKYSLQLKDWEARIMAEGFYTYLAANGPWVATFFFPNKNNSISLGGDPDEFLQSEVWNEIPRQHFSAAEWHWSLLKVVLTDLRRDFGKALNTGSAHIMARKNTVLAPFERVTSDQWLYFKLDEPEPVTPKWEDQHSKWAQQRLAPLRWLDPRSCGWEEKRYTSSTATGPSGEKLYAIHVAPGLGRAESGKLSSEQKCTQWLVESMTAFPERSPKPLKALIEEAVSICPGLSERGFGRALFSARIQTGNLKWITSGRPRKSPQ